jgi:starch synthase
MKILMVSSEALPFVKTGGLADAVPALAAALAAKGHDVRIVLPRYYRIDRDSLIPVPSPLGVPMGHGEMWCGIYQTILPNSTVQVYLVEREDLYGRDGLYGPDGSASWPDNALRYGFFSAAVFQLCRSLAWIPDILHLHDWQSGPTAWLLKNRERRRGFESSASVLTIHNLGYQGVFPESDLKMFFTEPEDGSLAGMLHGKYLNFLAAGLNNADEITTVSPTYAREILTPEFSEGLGDILSRRPDRLTGILNGMDYDEWDPSTDSVLAPDNYNPGKLDGKVKLKARLQREMGLPVMPDIPLFGMISRLTGQKGVDLLTRDGSPVMRIFREGRAQLAVLGSGEKLYQDALLRLSAEIPGGCSVRIAFNGVLSRLVEGGSDFFLMPSRYEPCGLNQMYSLRYGTLPVVSKTGGLADTVIDLSEDPRSGNGFTFENHRREDLAGALSRAISFYRDKKAMSTVIRRAMKIRFDWKSSAEQYLEVYKRALNRL